MRNMKTIEANKKARAARVSLGAVAFHYCAATGGSIYADLDATEVAPESFREGLRLARLKDADIAASYYAAQDEKTRAAFANMAQFRGIIL